MSQPRVPDDLWEAIEPLLPRERPKPRGGRPRIPDRAALGGIIFVLRTGTPWRLLRKELGCGSGPTCWRRLRDWQAAGAWRALHRQILNWLGEERAIDWARATVDAIPPIFGPRGKPGRPRFRPDKLHADKGYDYPEKLRALRKRGITPRIARKGIESGERLGRYRWVVERSLAWLLGFRRLGVRYERRAEMLRGLLHLACSLICIRFLK